MTKNQAKQRIQYLISELEKINNTEPETEAWFNNTKHEIRTMFGEDSEIYKNIVNLKFTMSFKNLSNVNQFNNAVLEAKLTLQKLIDHIDFYGLPDVEFGFYSKDVNIKTIWKILIRFSFIEWVKFVTPIIIIIILNIIYIFFGINPC
jgi:hypothetical protein